MARLEQTWLRRKEIWQRYQEAFSELPIVRPKEPAPNTKHAYHLYTILVDEDPRLEKGLAAGAWAIMCRGNAALSQDEALIREVTHAVLSKTLGKGDADQYLEPVMSEGRTIVTITPQDWLTWDYNKGDD